MAYAHPILSCNAAACYEKKLFGNHSEKEWAAMQQAGTSLAERIISDFYEIKPFPQNGLLLTLVGKGHNGGDALIATEEIMKNFPDFKAYILLASAEKELKPLTYRSLDRLKKRNKDCLEIALWPSEKVSLWASFSFTLSLDGLIGMNFKAPLRSPYREIIQWVNRFPCLSFKAAVDLPSGIGDQSDSEACQADFTYATGIAKTPLFKRENRPFTGRIRYLDLGFFNKPLNNSQTADTSSSILLPSILKPLQKLRYSLSDKRFYGHAFLLGGCQNMPGALLMSVLAALHSGAGLVTAAAPSSFCPSLAAAAPEAMWLPWKESTQGGWEFALYPALIKHLDRATALLIGPGMETQYSIQSLVQRLMDETSLPLVLDAGALQPEIATAAAKRKNHKTAIIITPHLGEFKRMASISTDDIDDKTLKQFCREHHLITILKGPVTRICNGEDLFYSPFGGPVLARGGSGDILAGLTVSLLVRPGISPFHAACQAVTWHGLSAEYLARQCGHEASRTTQLFSCLHAVLRSEK